jgi:hypothetical protein
MFCAVIHRNSSDNTAAMAFPISLASPRRPSAVFSMICGITSGYFSKASSAIRVLVAPGAIEFTRKGAFDVGDFGFEFGEPSSRARAVARVAASRRPRYTPEGKDVGAKGRGLLAEALRNQYGTCGVNE